jgi:TetR/AcrR family transcriptional regulator, copper-responsive repressor
MFLFKMVQKKKPARSRGRPRAYDPNEALGHARDAFWDAGYTGTSLEDLSSATGMNRPSLYGAFGDKRALYLRTLERYREMSRTTLKEELSVERPLADGLRAVFARAISIYVAGKRGGRGCFLVGTAATEAVQDSEVRDVLADGLHELDDLFEARLRQALDSGEIRSEIAPADLARVVCGIMNSLAVRARAGESRATLTATAEAGVRLVCQGS